MAVGSVPFHSVSLLLWLIDICFDIDICMLRIVIYCYELFSIWFIIWLCYCLGGVASTVDIICTADLLCYCCIVIGYDCLLGTVPSELFRRLCVVCVYGYGRVSICMAVGSVPFDSVSLILYLIDIWSDVDICMLCIVICCHELFRYLDYYLIMIFF